MVPEAWSKATTDLPKPWADMYAYCNSIMEPWDGPAALAMTDGRWVCGGLDRNGLRPGRFWETEDGLVVFASEVGVVDPGGEALDDPALLEPADPLVDRGGRHADGLAEVGVAHPAVLDEQLDDLRRRLGHELGLLVVQGFGVRMELVRAVAQQPNADWQRLVVVFHELGQV